MCIFSHAREEFAVDGSQIPAAIRSEFDRNSTAIRSKFSCNHVEIRPQFDRNLAAVRSNYDRSLWPLAVASGRTVAGSQPPTGDRDRAVRIADDHNRVQFRSKFDHDSIGRTTTVTWTDLGTEL